MKLFIAFRVSSRRKRLPLSAMGYFGAQDALIKYHKLLSVTERTPKYTCDIFRPFAQNRSPFFKKRKAPLNLSDFIPVTRVSGSFLRIKSSAKYNFIAFDDVRHYPLFPVSLLLTRNGFISLAILLRVSPLRARAGGSDST